MQREDAARQEDHAAIARLIGAPDGAQPAACEQRAATAHPRKSRIERHHAAAQPCRHHRLQQRVGRGPSAHLSPTPTGINSAPDDRARRSSRERKRDRAGRRPPPRPRTSGRGRARRAATAAQAPRRARRAPDPSTPSPSVRCRESIRDTGHSTGVAACRRGGVQAESAAPGSASSLARSELDRVAQAEAALGRAARTASSQTRDHRQVLMPLITEAQPSPTPRQQAATAGRRRRAVGPLRMSAIFFFSR